MHKIYIFWSKIAVYLSLGLLKGHPSLYKRILQPSKENIPALQNMKFLNFYLFLWVIFALLDPDQGSGSTDLIESDIRVLQRPFDSRWLKIFPLIAVESNKEASMKQFESLFVDLDNNLRRLGISTYGLSDTTLEEVYKIFSLFSVFRIRWIQKLIFYRLH